MPMLKYLVDNDISFHINTNGILVTEELIKLLINYAKGSIQFSLDGAEREADDFVRGKGHFDKVHRVIQKLKVYGYQRGILKMVINQKNYHQIEEYFEFAKKYDFLPTYAFIVKSGRAHEYWDELCIDAKIKCDCRDKIRKLYEENAEYINRYHSKELVDYLCNMNIHYVNECQFNNEPCDFTPLIHPDGSVQPCEGLFDKQFCIGNLLHEPPEYIFSRENPRVQRLRAIADIRRSSLTQSFCKECKLQKLCGKGCIAESYNTGNIYGPPMDCDMRRHDFLHAVLSMRK